MQRLPETNSKAEKYILTLIILTEKITAFEFIFRESNLLIFKISNLKV